jgi:hypothetical protein
MPVYQKHNEDHKHRLAMLNEAAKSAGLHGADRAAFVQSALDNMARNGGTKNHARAAVTAALARGK